MSPTTGLTISYGRLFNGVSRFDLNSLLTHLYNEFDNLGLPMIRGTKFTLVHVSNFLVGVGSEELDPPADYNSGLVFTFNMSNDRKRKIRKRRTSFQSQFTYVWGTDQSPMSYVTVGLPTHLLPKSLRNLLQQDIVYLYSIVGLATKNYVIHDTYWRKGVKFQSYTSDNLARRQRFLTLGLPALFNEYPQNNWQYNRALWEQCPNLILDGNLHEDFFLYFTLHLFHAVDLEHIDRKAFRQRYEKFLQAGVRQLIQLVTARSSPMSDNLACVLHLLYANVEPGGLGDGTGRDIGLCVAELLNNTEQDIRDPDLLRMLSPIDIVAKALVSQPDSLEQLSRSLW